MCAVAMDMRPACRYHYIDATQAVASIIVIVDA
jgi:hypothetical protein